MFSIILLFYIMHFAQKIIKLFVDKVESSWYIIITAKDRCPRAENNFKDGAKIGNYL